MSLSSFFYLAGQIALQPPLQIDGVRVLQALSRLRALTDKETIGFGRS
jgi:hypothetical protein